MGTNIGLIEIPDGNDFEIVSNTLLGITEKLIQFLQTNQTAQTVIQSIQKLL